jgi:hypothetical protein
MESDMKYNLNDMLFHHLKVTQKREYPNFEWYMLLNDQEAFFTLLRIKEEAVSKEDIDAYCNLVRRNHYPSCFLQIFSVSYDEKDHVFELLVQACTPCAQKSLDITESMKLSRSMLSMMKIHREQGIIFENFTMENIFCTLDGNYVSADLFSLEKKGGFYHLDQDIYDLALLLEENCNDSGNIEFQRFLLKAHNYGYASLFEVKQALEKIEACQISRQKHARKSKAVLSLFGASAAAAILCITLLTGLLFFFRPNSNLAMHTSSVDLEQMMLEEVLVLDEEKLSDWNLTVKSEVSAMYHQEEEEVEYTFLLLEQESRMSAQVLAESLDEEWVENMLSLFPYTLKESQEADWIKLFEAANDYLQEHGQSQKQDDVSCLVYEGESFYAAMYEESEKQSLYYILSNYTQSVLLEIQRAGQDGLCLVTFHYYKAG